MPFARFCFFFRKLPVVAVDSEAEAALAAELEVALAVELEVDLAAELEVASEVNT